MDIGDVGSIIHPSNPNPGLMSVTDNPVISPKTFPELLGEKYSLHIHLIYLNTNNEDTLDLILRNFATRHQLDDTAMLETYLGYKGWDRSTSKTSKGMTSWNAYQAIQKSKVIVSPNTSPMLSLH